MIVNGEAVVPTERFWNSLFARHHFNQCFFRYFGHEEVFRRIAEVEPRDRMRLCVERDERGGEPRLLAVSNPSKAIVPYDDLLETLELYDGERISYSNGVVESFHTPRLGGSAFDIAGDTFNNRFVVSVPIDGFGLPNIYLSLLRQVCANGAIGYAPAFRSELATGRGEDNAIYSIVRALDGFSSDEGYAALRQRFASAAKSWASVGEAQSLYRLIPRVLHDAQQRRESTVPAEASGDADPAQHNAQADAPTSVAGAGRVHSQKFALSAFHEMTGDVSQIYGLANVDALSVKRQRTLPVKCRVYDLLNFASELATHHATGSGARTAQGWIGTLISREYDLEESCDAFRDFRDFFLDRKLNGAVAMDLQRVGR